MKIAVAAALCLTVVAVAAANQRKGCAERGGECKSVEKGDQTCQGGVQKLDCPGKDRCCLPKGDRNQVESAKGQGGKKSNKPNGERSGNGRPPSRGGNGKDDGDGDKDGQGPDRPRSGKGSEKPRHGRKPSQSPDKPRHGRKPSQSPDKPRHGRKPTQRPDKPRHGRKPSQSPDKPRHGRKPSQSPDKPRHGRKPSQSPDKPRQGRKPNQNGQGGGGDKPRGGKKPNKGGEEGNGDKRGEGGKETGKRFNGKPVHAQENSGQGKPPSQTGKDGGSIRQSCRVKKQCKQLKGKCQSASAACKGQSYTGNKFCTGSCSCCVKTNQLCRPKNKCKKRNGTCQFKWDVCNGQMLKKACKGSSSACVCCAPKSCKDKNNLCSAAGGSCVFKEATCPGQVDSSLCGKFCQCCLAAPPPTTVGPSPIPSTLPPTTAAPATVSPGTESSASPPTTGGPPSPTESPTGPPSPPTNSATEMQTATTVPSTTTACNASRAYCSDCGIAPINVVGYKIVNGLDASPDEYPYQVIVVPTINGAQYQCGGSIIKKRWVLTAAHCFFDRSGNQPSQNGVVVGYGNINQYLTTQVSSTRYIVHENYDSTTHANDIALIELPSDLNFVNNPAVQPICLAVESDIPYGGKAVATGWGTLVYQGTTLPVILQEVALDIINISQCQPLVSLPTDTSTVLCALTPTKDTCQGDSGGPLVAKVCPNKWVQIGIVSYGYRCAYPDNPGVYTRVSAFRQWIDVNTGSSTSC